LKLTVRRIAYAGNSRRCDVCGGTARSFLRYGTPRRADACCPWCHSLERHRLVWNFFKQRTNLFDGQAKRMLHVAPEACFKERLQEKLGDGYLTADLMAPGVMERMDVTNIQHPDNSFDVIYCSHVLEHVEDDRKAMREFHRILSPSGWAVLLVPIVVEKTFEDPTITDPAERKRVFFQHDHVRNYGPDYEDRLREAGFKVRKFTPSEVIPEAGLASRGLSTEAAGDIYFCTK